jgi:hypothetical protein
MYQNNLEPNKTVTNFVLALHTGCWTGTPVPLATSDVVGGMNDLATVQTTFNLFNENGEISRRA